jgi:nucleotide-binding universal stress UspA family protein
MIKRILIGIDDSTYAEHAAKYGFNLAETLKAHVGLVHVNEPMAIPMANSGADAVLGTSMQGLSGMDDVNLLNAQTEISANIIAHAAKKYGGKLEVTQFNEYGPTAESIINCGKEFKADMIVIGTHSRSGFDRLLMGSVAEYVVRHSEIPVLVVPSGS